MNVLFLGAHPDDIELGCGGTIHKHVKDWQITSFTFCNKALQNRFPDLVDCHHKAMKSLCVANVKVGDFYPSYMQLARNDVWDKLYDLNQNCQPDLVFTHSPDEHQDHQVVYNETLRVFFKSSVVCYHIPRSEQCFQHNYYETLTYDNASAKVRALKEYYMYAFDGDWRPSVQACMDENNILALLRVNGVYVGTEYAEVFRIIKWVQ